MALQRSLDAMTHARAANAAVIRGVAGAFSCDAPPSTGGELTACCYALDLLVDSGHSCLSRCGAACRIAAATRGWPVQCAGREGYINMSAMPSAMQADFS